MKDINRQGLTRDRNSIQNPNSNPVQKKGGPTYGGLAKDSLVQRSINDQAKSKPSSNTLGLEQEADIAGQSAAQGGKVVVNGQGSGIQKKELKDLPESERRKTKVSMDNNTFQDVSDKDFFDSNSDFLIEHEDSKKLAASAEFNGVDAIIQPGFKKMLELYIDAGFIKPQSSTVKIVRFTETNFIAGNLTLDASVRVKANQNIAYRITRYDETKVLNGKTVKTPKILVEELGEVKDRKLAPVDKEAFKKKFFTSFKMEGPFKEEEKDMLYEVTSKLPEATIAKIKGVTFKRESVDAEDPNEAGHYDINTHTIAIYNIAFDNKDYLLGNSVTGFYNFAYMTMFHEIGHAVDGSPVRPSYKQQYADTENYNKLADKYNDNLKKKIDNSQLTPKVDAAKVKSDQSSALYNSKHTLSGDHLEDTHPIKSDTAFRLALNADGGKAISSYGGTSVSENFAECYALYYTDPERLKLLRPNVYAYFKAQGL